MGPLCIVSGKFPQHTIMLKTFIIILYLLIAK
jgi:hypothetical protein